MLSSSSSLHWSCLQWVTFPGKSWFIIIAVVPFVLSFKRRDNLMARVVCEPLWAKISYLILGGLQPLWPICIVFIDLSDFRQTSPKHSRNNDKRKCVGKFLYISNICPVASIYAAPPRIFFSYSSFRCRYLDKQSEYRISAAHVSWLMPCEWDYAAILLVLRHPIPDKLKKKFDWRTFVRFTSYRLLTLRYRKSRFNLYFHRKLQLLSFLGF